GGHFRKIVIALGQELRGLTHPVAQQELQTNQRVDHAVGPGDQVVVALHAQRLDAQALLAARRIARNPERDDRDGGGREIELKLDRRPETVPLHGGLGEELVHTITLPSSVTASSMLTVASLMSISLWARPDGIIGKQFSPGSTTQSKITGFLTLIISRM